MAGRPRTPIRSQLGYSTETRIVVRERDLCQDLIGQVNLGDMVFFELTGRFPTPGESVLCNAALVTLVEHGVTPSALAARLTYLGSPEALQAAVAAGLLGAGSVFLGSMEGAARALTGLLGQAGPDPDLAALAEGYVAEQLRQRQTIPGIGHPVHRRGDPRAARLFALARQHGCYGRHCQLMEQIAAAAARRSGKQLPVNATGAIGALLCELGLDWRIARGFGLISRCIGLVGHVNEELQQPMAREVWQRVEDEVAEAAGAGEQA